MDAPVIACSDASCAKCHNWHPGDRIPSGGVLPFSSSNAQDLPSQAVGECFHDPCKFSKCPFYHKGAPCPPTGIRSRHAKHSPSGAPDSSNRSLGSSSLASSVAFAPGNLCRAGAACKRPNCKFDHPAPSDAQTVPSNRYDESLGSST